MRSFRKKIGYEGDAEAHLKKQVTGRDVAVAVTDSKVYGEFNRGRRKRGN